MLESAVADVAAKWSVDPNALTRDVESLLDTATDLIDAPYGFADITSCAALVALNERRRIPGHLDGPVEQVLIQLAAGDYEILTGDPATVFGAVSRNAYAGLEVKTDAGWLRLLWSAAAWDRAVEASDVDVILRVTGCIKGEETNVAYVMGAQRDAYDEPARTEVAPALEAIIGEITAGRTSGYNAVEFLDALRCELPKDSFGRWVHERLPVLLLSDGALAEARATADSAQLLLLISECKRAGAGLDMVVKFERRLDGRYHPRTIDWDERIDRKPFRTSPRPVESDAIDLIERWRAVVCEYLRDEEDALLGDAMLSDDFGPPWLLAALEDLAFAGATQPTAPRPLDDAIVANAIATARVEAGTAPESPFQGDVVAVLATSGHRFVLCQHALHLWNDRYIPLLRRRHEGVGWRGHDDPEVMRALVQFLKTVAVEARLAQRDGEPLVDWFKEFDRTFVSIRAGMDDGVVSRWPRWERIPRDSADTKTVHDALVALGVRVRES